MDFFRQYNLSPVKIAKIIALGLLAIFALTFVISLFNSSFRSIISNKNYPTGSMGEAVSYGVAPGYPAGMGGDYDDGGYANLSVRNIMPPISPQPGSVGDAAEEYEVVEYHATIETRELDSTCAVIADLKKSPDIIFENANQSEHYCNFSFKVKKAQVASVLAIINQLDPKDLNENTYTIQRQIEDYTSEVEILEKKKLALEETLQEALSSYEDITTLATRTLDIASLTKIIDSKIQIIERLTQERIAINDQLDRLSRAKAEQLDRLAYTNFNVNIYENKYFDGEQLKDSWKASLRQFFTTVNQGLQDATINLLALLVTMLQYIIIFFILLLTAKYGWRTTKRIWQK